MRGGLAIPEGTDMADILDYCEGMEEVTFEPGATLIKEGVPTRKLYVLIEGEVDVIRRDQQVTHIDEPGSIFGGKLARALRQFGDGVRHGLAPA